MSLHADTTILTTEGVKTIKELVDQPFNAIIDNDVFPSLGAQFDGKKDLYLLKAVSGHSVITTFDQFFFTKDRTFKPINEFHRREKLTLSLSQKSFGGEDEYFEPSPTDIYPEFEYYSSDFYIEFLKCIWYAYGYINDRGLHIIYDLSLKAHASMIQRMLQRLGVQVMPQFSRNVNGVMITKKAAINNFHSIVLGEDLPYIPHPSVASFKSLEYFDTSYTYSCEITGVRAYDANCFYVGDST